MCKINPNVYLHIIDLFNWLKYNDIQVVNENFRCYKHKTPQPLWLGKQDEHEIMYFAVTHKFSSAFEMAFLRVLI